MFQEDYFSLENIAICIENYRCRWRSRCLEARLSSFLALSYPVALGKLLFYLVPWFSHLLNGNNNATHFIVLWERFSEIIFILLYASISRHSSFTLLFHIKSWILNVILLYSIKQASIKYKIFQDEWD